MPPTAATTSGSLLEPGTLQRIASMELVARHVMDGYVQGMHRSPHVGFALDFAQHRQYVPGDDIKRIDWRVFAKADRYYIKQYEVSTNVRALIEAMHHLRHQRHEVLLFHTMAEDELTFPFRRWSLFEDLERPGERLKLDPALMRAVYLENLSAHLKTIRDAASRMNLGYVML